MGFLRIIPFAGFFLFLTLLAVKTIQVKSSGAKPAVRKNRVQGSFRTLFLLSFFVLFAFELIARIKWPDISILPAFLSTEIHTFTFIQVIGVVLILLSLLALYFALQAFGTSLRFGLSVDEPGELQTSGIFSLTRNPFFLSIELMFTGIAMVFPTPFFMAIGALAIVTIHFYILKEEKFMHRMYGKEYREYCKNVRRYL